MPMSKTRYETSLTEKLCPSF